jgi:hypothetical protein
MAILWKYFTPIALAILSLLTFFSPEGSRVLFWHMDAAGKITVAVVGAVLAGLSAWGIYRMDRSPGNNKGQP